MTRLLIEGMTCAACVARVERKLARLPGVTATVNLATGQASVSHPRGVSPDELIGAVEAAGYTAGVVPDASAPAPTRGADTGGAGRLLLVVLLTVPVLALSMVPPWQFRGWQWLCFALTACVATWGAWPIHRQALRGLRHGAVTMDTLVALGATASFGWSGYALLGRCSPSPTPAAATRRRPPSPVRWRTGWCSGGAWRRAGTPTAWPWSTSCRCPRTAPWR